MRTLKENLELLEVLRDKTSKVPDLIDLMWNGLSEEELLEHEDSERP